MVRLVCSNNDHHANIHHVDCHIAKGANFLFENFIKFDANSHRIFAQQMKISGSSPIFRNSDGSAIFVFLFVYSISITTFSFMLSVLFSRPNVASAAAGMAWFFSYVPYLCALQFDTLWKFVACIFTNSAMAFGFQLIIRLEGSGVGLQWSNFWQPFNDYDSQITVGISMCFMLGEALLYLLIALYVDKSKPRNFGVPKKSATISSSHAADASNNFEDEPQFQRIGVQVKSLAKTFGKKVACKNLSLNMYENQITVLLGHNGMIVSVSF